jgi:DNA-binding transcriptional LysR family regulator
MDRLFAMQAFAEIARRGSLTAAANALDRSPPTVVRILATLERELRVKLIHRTTRRLSITDEGRLYLELCRRVLGELEEGERALSDRQTVPAGPVSVTAPVRFGEMHVAPLLTRFLAAHQQVEARLLLLDRPIDLLEEGIDVAVRIGSPRDSSLIARPVGEVREVVVASPGFLERVGTPRHPTALATAPCVRFLGIASEGTNWFFAGGPRAIEVPVAARLSCNQAAAMVQACVAGLGFGRCLSYQVMPEVRAGRLRIVLAQFELPPRPVTVLYPPNRAPSARVRALVDWLANGLKKALLEPHPPSLAERTAPRPRGRAAQEPRGLRLRR